MISLPATFGHAKEIAPLNEPGWNKTAKEVAKSAVSFLWFLSLVRSFLKLIYRCLRSTVTNKVVTDSWLSIHNVGTDQRNHVARRLDMRTCSSLVPYLDPKICRNCMHFS